MRITEIITELTGVKQQLAQNTYAQVLAQHGFHKIGQGDFGTAWSNPRLDYVLKVYDQRDTAYTTWVTTCKWDLKNNPFVPKFLGRGSLRIHDAVYAERMETLTPITGPMHTVIEAVNEIVDDFTVGDQQDQSIDDVYYYIRRGADSDNRYDDEDEEPIDYNTGPYQTVKEYLPSLGSSANDFEYVITTIIELVRNSRYQNDVIHNVMMRGNTPVFMDPLHL